MAEGPPRWRVWAWRLVRLVGTTLAVAWVVRQIDPGQAWGALTAAPAWAFFVPFALMVTNAGLQGRRYQLLLQAGGVALPWARTTRIVLQALFVGQVLPRGGADVLRVAWLRRDTGRTDAVVAALLVARLLEVLAMLALLLYALSWGVADRWPWVGLAAAGFAGAFLAFTALVLATARFGERAVAWVPWAPVRRHGGRFARALQSVGRDAPRLARAAALTVPMAAGNVLAAWAVMRAYGLALPLGDAFAVVPALDSVILLPVTVSGLGLREGVFVHVLGPMGVAQPVAVAMALTRWAGELGRAALGGALFLSDGTLQVGRGSRGAGLPTGGDP